MPLPALPDNLTDRIFVDYVSALNASAVEHTFQMRTPGPLVDAATAQDRVLGFLQAVGADKLWAGWKVVRVRYQKAGTSITLPQTVGVDLSAFVGTASGYSALTNPLEGTLQGRSPTTGRRVDISLYGLAFTGPNAQFRITTGDAGYGAWVAGVVAYLNGLTDAFITKDGTSASWYPYLNWNYNSYWERRARVG